VRAGLIKTDCQDVRIARDGAVDELWLRNVDLELSPQKTSPSAKAVE